MIKLNETPVRTARNFNINNIKIEDISLKNMLEDFENIEVMLPEGVEVENATSSFELKYGMNEEKINEVKENANHTLKLKIAGKVKEQVEIVANFDDENVNLIQNIEIIAQENSKANIVLKYKSEDDTVNYKNSIIRIKAEKNANINIVVVNLLNTSSTNLLSIENEIEEGAVLNYIGVDFGGKNSITNYYSKLNGNEAKNNIDVIYLGKDEQLFDLNYIGELRGEKTQIEIEVQGALKDMSKKHFKGTIDFKKGCKKAKGNENEFCMLLSDTAKSIALPMLLCSEEDVEGNHSSATGKVGNKELFYIMSRGFEYKEAMKLLVRARFNKILEKIKDEELKNEILEEINERLN